MDWLLNDLSYLLGVIGEEAQHLVSIDWYRQNFVPLVNIIMIDLVLAGDNAIIVGLAASRVPKEIRSKVIFWGIAAAVVLRIFFAAITVQLLAIIGLTLAGGLLLLYGVGTIIGPTIGGPVMTAAGPYGLFMITACAHILITAYAIIRSRMRAPVPASDRDAFSPVNAGAPTTPESLQLSPRAAPFEEARSEPDNNQRWEDQTDEPV